MIERYQTKEMKYIWSEENKFQKFLDVEIAACEAYYELGVIPKEELLKIVENSTFTVSRIKEIERTTKHDVIAFTRTISESLGEEKKWIHYGLTSTDVVDTANGLLLREANEILKKDLLELLKVLKDKALKYKNIPCIGRTHGVHAEITSFGLKYALWYEDLKRAILRFKNARSDIEVGKLSGAVGNFANIDPYVQYFVCNKLKLKEPSISTQVIQRDNHAYYMATLALIGSILDKISIEFRSLQRTEIGETEEGFSKGQKGSSAMPHKRNPISFENISGCSRLLKGYMISSFDNITLWHERDISHSSVERVIFPDATSILDYSLKRMIKILKKIVIKPEKMLENIYLTNGLVFSENVLTSIINKGKSREEAYDLVQKIAMHSYEKKLDFQELLKKNKEILKILSIDEIIDCFDICHFLKYVDRIYHKLGIVKVKL
jgi:adenylosuccinate lyase